MNGVLGMTELLLDTALDAGAARLRRDRRAAAAEALLTVINDILDFSKIEAGKLDLERVDFDAARRRRGRRRAARAPAGARRARARRLGRRRPCPPSCSGDPDRLRQVLTNLVGNAVKFTEPGEVVVDVEPDRARAP